MSTDLQLRQELLEIRCPAMTIKVNLSSSSSLSSDVANDDNTGGIVQSRESTISDGNDESADECRTPTSPRHMIPEIFRCPPAPKKPRRVASCKRKLCDFFEIVAREEVESFFREFEAKPSTGSTVVKKRCPV